MEDVTLASGPDHEHIAEAMHAMAANKTSRNGFPCNLAGLRFGRLAVLRRSDRRGKDRRIYWVCACNCGHEVEILSRSLYRGATSSCGCLGKERRREANSTHGRTQDGIYQSWLGMVQRCRNPNSSAYRHYGGRGIEVCARWADSFEAFAGDMGERPEGCCIERIDNDGNYCPENCRWATRKEQSSNTRRTRHLTADGETHTLTEWAEILGIFVGTLRWRIKQWGTERAITTYGPRTKATSGTERTARVEAAAASR